MALSGQLVRDRIRKNQTPVAYIVVRTNYGVRLFSKKQANSTLQPKGIRLDGKVKLDGSFPLGGFSQFISKQSNVVSFGQLSRKRVVDHKQLIVASRTKRQQTMSIVLNNTDRKLTQMMAKEPFISQMLEMYLGFNDIPFSNHVKTFEGLIYDVALSQDIKTLTLKAKEV